MPRTAFRGQLFNSSTTKLPQLQRTFEHGSFLLDYLRETPLSLAHQHRQNCLTMRRGRNGPGFLCLDLSSHEHVDTSP